MNTSPVEEVPRLILTKHYSFNWNINKRLSSHYRIVTTDPLATCHGSLGICRTHHGKHCLFDCLLKIIWSKYTLCNIKFRVCCVFKIPRMQRKSTLFGTSTRGSDKSLARPGRKQATAIKLGIYSTYSPRSKIHFLARCYNFCKTLKKIRNLPVQPGPRGSNDLRVGRKMATFQLFFSVQGTSGRSTGPHPEKRAGDEDIGSPGRPVSFGLQVPSEPGNFRARTRHPWWPSRGVFPSKCHFIAPAEMSNTPGW